MVFGSFCYRKCSLLETIKTKSIRITGIQKGFVQSLEIYQSIETCDELKEVSYVFPTDNKICIYDMHFLVGDEIIPAQLRSKTQAQKIFDEAKKEGKTAVMGIQNEPGITYIAIGNVPKNTIVAIVFKCSFTSILENRNTILTKIPLKSYNSDGFLTNFYDLPSFDINLEMTISQIGKISDVYSNIDYEYSKNDDYNGKLTIKSTKIKDENIMIHTRFEDPIKSQIVQTEKASIISIIPEFETIKSDNKELVFLIDCSGSMHGESIRKAKETLSMFISKLSQQIYFNIICFGTLYTKLFDQSQINSKENNEKAIEFIEKIEANLGGTELLKLLTDLFHTDVKISWQRQIFLVTDGEVEKREEVVNLIKENNVYNRIFAIGLGNGSDAGFLEEITEITNGKYDLILNEKELPNKINEHFELSKTDPAINTELHIEGNDSFQVVPYPLPTLLPYVLQHIFITSSLLIDNVIITSKLSNSIDIENVITNKSQLNEKLPIFALFAQQQLKKIESDEEKSIKLSLESGVLSKFTSYVAVSNNFYIENEDMEIFEDYQEVHYAYQLVDDYDSENLTLEKLRRIAAELGEEIDDDELQKMLDAVKGDKDISIEITNKNDANDNDEENHVFWDENSSFEDILRLQNCEGFWDLSSSFINSKTIGQLLINEIDLPQITTVVRKRILSVIFVICYLEKFYNDDKSKWIQAREKSIKWLSEINGNANWEEIITINSENILQ